MESIADIAAEEAKYLIVVDAAKGYHQRSEDEESQLYTMLSLHYTRDMVEAFEWLMGFRQIVNDSVIYGKDIESDLAHVRQFLQRCQELQVCLNRDKCVFC